MKRNYIEPYIKENNILQLSLFYFGKEKPKKTVVDWKDDYGDYQLKCVCDYGVPGSFDQDVYTACMRIWVKQGMPKGGIKLNYSDVARELNLFPEKNWVTKIKKALMKLAQARYELKQCFIKADENGNIKIDTHFSLFDSATLFTHHKGEGKSKKTSESQLIFPDVIAENLEAKYYQFLEMVWYRKLPEGLPRRLYEYLEKRRYHSIDRVFVIGEAAICRWLPIIDKNTTCRRKRLETIAKSLIEAGYLESYSFDKTKKLCTFTYAKENIALADKTSQVVIEPAIEKAYLPQQAEKQSNKQEQTEYLEIIRWLDSIPYFHQARKDEIAAIPISDLVKVYPGIRKEFERLKKAGEKPKASWIYSAFMQRWTFEDEAKLAASPEGQEAPSAELQELLALMKLKTPTEKLQLVVAKYLEEKGPEYVKWNILYANKQAKKNYSPYLQQSLEQNWAEEWTAVEQQMEKIRAKHHEEHRRAVEEALQQQQKFQEIDEQKPRFLERLWTFDRDTARQLWAQANDEVEETAFRRENLVKLAYAKAVLQHLLVAGEDFHPGLMEQMDFGFFNGIVKITLKR